MNILFSCDEYPPAKTGGIGSATKIVCEALAARGHNVYVVSGRLPGHGLPKEAIINAVTVYRVSYFKKISFLLNKQWKINSIHRYMLHFGMLKNYAVKEHARMHAFIQNLICTKNIDLVEIPDYTILDKYYIERKFIPSYKYPIPCIGRVHGCKSFLTYNESRHINPIARKNNTSFFNTCDKILAVSKYSADFVNKVLNIQNPCEIIYNPLDTSFIEQARKLNVPREKNIVFLGKVIETKGAFNLLKAFEIFQLQYPDFKLIMIGGGLIDKAKTIVSHKTLEKVMFTGYIKREQIAYYLKSSAFCVIPTYYENFSVAALEVMGCGNILIYTETTSGPEIIEDGINGFLVNPYDVNAIASKMSFVASNLQSLVPIREKAIATINDRFRQDIIIDKLEQYYKSVIRQ